MKYSDQLLEQNQVRMVLFFFAYPVFTRQIKTSPSASIKNGFIQFVLLKISELIFDWSFFYFTSRTIQKALGGVKLHFCIFSINTGISFDHSNSFVLNYGLYYVRAY